MTDFERGYRQGQADYFRWVKTFSGGKPNYVIPPETPEVTPYVTPDDRGSTGEVPGKLEIPEREESAGKPINGEAQLPNGKAMTREDIIRMAREANLWQSWLERLEESRKTIASLEKFAALVAAHEREECAKVCEAGVVQTNNWDARDYNKACEIRAAAIRNRGEK